jgi:hypothetical protein
VVATVAVAEGIGVAELLVTSVVICAPAGCAAVPFWHPALMKRAPEIANAASILGFVKHDVMGDMLAFRLMGSVRYRCNTRRGGVDRILEVCG